MFLHSLPLLHNFFLNKKVQQWGSSSLRCYRCLSASGAWLNLLNLLLVQPLPHREWNHRCSTPVCLVEFAAGTRVHRIHRKSSKARTEIIIIIIKTTIQTKLSGGDREDKDTSWQIPRLLSHLWTGTRNNSKEVLTSNLFHNRLQKIEPHLKIKKGGVISSEQTTACKRAPFRFPFIYLVFQLWVFSPRTLEDAQETALLISRCCCTAFEAIQTQGAGKLKFFIILALESNNHSKFGQ